MCARRDGWLPSSIQIAAASFFDSLQLQATQTLTSRRCLQFMRLPVLHGGYQVRAQLYGKYCFVFFFLWVKNLTSIFQGAGELNRIKELAQGHRQQTRGRWGNHIVRWSNWEKKCPSVEINRGLETVCITWNCLIVARLSFCTYTRRDLVKQPSHPTGSIRLAYRLHKPTVTFKLRPFLIQFTSPVNIYS